MLLHQQIENLLRLRKVSILLFLLWSNQIILGMMCCVHFLMRQAKEIKEKWSIIKEK